MDILKKHILFFSGLFVCTALLVAGLVFCTISGLEYLEKSKTFNRTEKNLQRMLLSSPSPVDENVVSSSLNLEELSKRLKIIRTELERGEQVEASVDGVRVAAGIQQYISKFTSLAKNHDTKYGPIPIEIPKDFAFGFDRFKLESEVPDDPREIEMLDKQRDLLDFLLGELYAVDPKSILSVKRQSARNFDDDDFYNDSSIFDIGSSISSKVEGAIDTLAFEISFSGKTNTLRGFLNRLVEFKRPIVVRSINVSRPTESIKRKIFEDAEEDQQDSVPEVKETRDPVVTENTSEFTLILEYIEIVLPEDIYGDDDTI